MGRRRGGRKGQSAIVLACADGLVVSIEEVACRIRQQDNRVRGR